MSEIQKPLPSDEKRVHSCLLFSAPKPLLVALLAQVRAEVSREKDAEIERLRDALAGITATRIAIECEKRAAEAECDALREENGQLETALADHCDGQRKPKSDLVGELVLMLREAIGTHGETCATGESCSFKDRGRALLARAMEQGR